MTMCVRFKEVLLSFCDELIESWPNITEFAVAKVFASNCDPAVLSSKFKRKIIPYKKYIQERNEEFFLSPDCEIFGNADPTKVGFFQQLWQRSDMTDEDKKVIWDWFDALIHIAEKC